MGAVQAVNIGYSPKHAAPPAPHRPPPRLRFRVITLMVLALALLAAGTGIVALRSWEDRCLERASGCGRSASAPPMRVLIDSSAAYGLRYPAAITVDHGHLWVADSAAGSVTEFGWKAGSPPVIWSGQRYDFSRPGAITAR